MQRGGKVVIILLLHRDVAQFGSVHVWGTWGRRFKSCHLDHAQAAEAQKRLGRFYFHYRPISSLYRESDPDFTTSIPILNVTVFRERHEVKDGTFNKILG